MFLRVIRYSSVILKKKQVIFYLKHLLESFLKEKTHLDQHKNTIFESKRAKLVQKQRLLVSFCIKQQKQRWRCVENYI